MSLTVLLGGRRKVIKLTPNTAMQSVLEMACKEHGIADWSSYGLVHKKASIDLSQPFRFTGVPNNAMVDLVEQRGQGKQQVRVALQAAGGGRLTETFDADTTIAEIIGHWVSAGQLDGSYATAEDVQVVFMRQNYQGRGALQTTSLRSMGLSSGSALLNVRVQSNGPSGVASASTSMDAYGAGGSSNSSSGGDCGGGVGGGGNSGGGGGGDVRVEESEGDPARAAQHVTYASANEPIPMDVVSPPPSSSTTDPPHPPPPTHAHTDTDTHPPTPTASTEPQRSPATPRMERGFEAAKAALEQLRASGFDDDVKESFALLAKYIDNIVGRPGESKTRTIRCSNIHYQQKIGSRPGGPAFLAALGFVEELRGFDHQVARDPAAFTYLVLPPVHEDTPLLLRARALLQDAARSMDLDIGPAPDPERRRAAAAPAFDPFKPSFMSTAMQVPREQGPSVTEQKLAELKRKQSEIQGQLPGRSIQVFSPGMPVSQSPVAGASSSSASAMVEDTDDRDSQAIVAKSVAARMAQRRKDEDRPFTTRALRELESLEKAKVYAHTVLRITLSDRTVVMAKFHPRETVGDVRRVLREEVLSEVGKSKPFTLYMSPPKRILQDSAVLQEQGMVPAAVVYLSFDDNASSSMDLISEGLLAHAVEQSSGATPPQALYPVGVRLVERPQEEEKTMRASGAGAAGGGRGGGSVQQAKKPAWLKL